jgi:hypothetical protein
MIYRALLLMLCSLPHLSVAVPFDQAQEFVHFSLSQPTNTEIACEYFFRQQTETTTPVSAKLAQYDLSVLKYIPYSESGKEIAILFLVDSSDPKRKRVIQKNIEHIQMLVSQAKPYHKLGLATFAAEFKELAALGSSPEMLKQQLQILSPTGQRTELYLYTLQALNLLRSTNAQRKALFLFSDGLAEDSSQKDFHSNLTDVARSYNIAIYSFSYQLKPNLSKGVEILRKLSLDTYGLLFETNAKLELPDNFARDIFTLLESGGTVIYDISSILSTGLSGQQAFEITWQTGENTFI